MSRTFVGVLPIFLLLFIGSLANTNFLDTRFLSDGNVLQVNLTALHDSVPYKQQISIAASSNATFNVTNVSSSASFIILQIHAYQHNITLSLDKNYLNKVSNKSVFGSNIGLFSRPTSNAVTQLFVKNDNIHNVTALLVVISYNNRAPIPGGCNMEFNTEIAPYARVQTLPTMVIVDVQPSSVPESNNSQPICEKNPVEHEMYQMFLGGYDFSKESYFAGISQMLTVEDIRIYGHKVATPIITSSMRRVFNAYNGVGSVYVAVATYGKYSAAYVPAFSYACNPIVDPESCEILTTGFSKFLCIATLIAGFLAVFIGHWVHRSDMVLPVFFTGAVIGYAMLGSTGYAMLIGLGYVTLWMVSMFLSFCGPLLFTMSLGFFFSCVAYLHSPDSFVILQNDWVFWILFLTIAVAVSLVTVLSFDVGIIIVCAIFSSFLVVLSLDYLIGGTLKYLIINIIRRISVEGFNLAVVRPPVQTCDITLIVLWTCLALYRLLKHYHRDASISPSRTPLLQ